MPTKSEWERQLERIYEGKASRAEVADKLGVTESDVSQMYDRFLKELLEERERKLDQIEKEVGEKERKIKSLSEGIERTDEKLKKTEEKLPRMAKLEETFNEWEQKIRESANTWKKAKKRIKTSLIIIGILVLVLGIGTYFLTGGGTPPAKFKTENLELSSKEAFVGESVTLSLDVTNVGESAGTYEANLKFNGKSVGKKEVALNPDESQTINIAGTVEENGSIQVRINGLTDNFIAFKPFPSEGMYATYRIIGVIENIGRTLTGTETYKVTNVTQKNYTQKLIPKEGFTTINNTQIYTTSLETPLSIKDKEWENYENFEIVTENTNFGTMELLHYRLKIETDNGTEIRDLYQKENIKIPIVFEYIIYTPSFGLVRGELDETNVNYLKKN